MGRKNQHTPLMIAENLVHEIAYVSDDERVEVTPNEVRMRKVELNPSFRKKRDKVGG